MKCPDCSTTMEERRVPTYDLGDLFGLSSVTLRNPLAHVCPKCGLVLVPGHAIDAAHERLVEVILGARHVLSGEEIRFLRKAATLSQAALAERLGVHRVEVTRWETSTVGVSSPVSLAIRAVVAHALFGLEGDKVARVGTAFDPTPMGEAPPRHEIESAA